MGCHFLLQGIFPTQGLNLGLLNWQVGSLQLRHLGSLRVIWGLAKPISKLLDRTSQAVSSVTQPSQTLCDPMDCSTPGCPVHHQFPEPLKLMCIEPVMHPTISPSVVPFSSCFQSFPASGSFNFIRSVAPESCSPPLS